MEGARDAARGRIARGLHCKTAWFDSIAMSLCINGFNYHMKTKLNYYSIFVK